jgi:Fe-S cluster biogenesis protein NfuA
MKEEVIKAIESMRPYLQADDGDMEFVELSQDGIVTIKFTGACSICPLSPDDLKSRS